MFVYMQARTNKIITAYGVLVYIDDHVVELHEVKVLRRMFGVKVQTIKRWEERKNRPQFPRPMYRIVDRVVRPGVCGAMVGNKAGYVRYYSTEQLKVVRSALKEHPKVLDLNIKTNTKASIIDAFILQVREDFYVADLRERNKNVKRRIKS